MNWLEILKEIKRSLKEPDSGGHWADSELLRRANIGQRKITRFTGCLQTIDNTLLSVSGQREYDKPVTALRIIRVLYAGKRIYGIPISELDISVRDWQEKTGTPTNYYETFGKIGLYPTPTVAGDIIGREYIIKPADLSGMTSIPFNSVAYLEDYHDLIISFVLWRCLLEDGNQLYAEHKNDYFQGITNLRNEMRNKPDELLTFGLIKNKRGSGRNPLPFMNAY